MQRDYAVVGLLHKTRLTRKLANACNSLAEAGKLYFKDLLPIKIEIHNREMYPSTKEPSIDALKEEEQRALESLRDRIKGVCNNSKAVLQELKRISEKMTEAERKEMAKEIQEIPKQVKPLR